MSSLTRKNVLAYLNRDWEAARRHKDVSLSRWVSAHGPDAAFRLGDMLLRQVWDRARLEKATQGYDGLIELRRKLNRANTKRR